MTTFIGYLFIEHVPCLNLKNYQEKHVLRFNTVTKIIQRIAKRGLFLITKSMLDMFWKCCNNINIQPIYKN